jgi:peptidoglycan/xylan/chitin deacetylase (PgdA/CDA1 family)
MEQRCAIRRLADAAGIDLAEQCREHIMDWDEVRRLAADPLCTIGAHTRSHYAVAKLAPEQALAEMRGGAARLQEQLGRAPSHFAYPYGDPGSAAARDFALAREAGFATAVTARPGLVYRQNADHLTALPRVSLTEAYPAERYADVILSGAPHLLYARGRVLNLS